MVITYWKNSNGIIYKYYGGNRPIDTRSKQVTKEDYDRAMQLAWANFAEKIKGGK